MVFRIKLLTTGFTKNQLAGIEYADSAIVFVQQAEKPRGLSRNFTGLSINFDRP